MTDPLYKRRQDKGWRCCHIQRRECRLKRQMGLSYCVCILDDPKDCRHYAVSDAETMQQVVTALMQRAEAQAESINSKDRDGPAVADIILSGGDARD